MYVHPYPFIVAGSWLCMDWVPTVIEWFHLYSLISHQSTVLFTVTRRGMAGHFLTSNLGTKRNSCDLVPRTSVFAAGSASAQRHLWLRVS